MDQFFLSPSVSPAESPDEFFSENFRILLMPQVVRD